MLAVQHPMHQQNSLTFCTLPVHFFEYGNDIKDDNTHGTQCQQHSFIKARSMLVTMTCGPPSDVINRPLSLSRAQVKLFCFSLDKIQMRLRKLILLRSHQ